MELSEFKKLPRGPYEGDRWVWKKTVASPLGPLSVEFGIYEDRNPPDEEMLRRGRELARYVEERGEYVLDLVYGAYLAAGRYDFLEYSGVPEGLTRETICEYLREGQRCLVVSRDPDMEGTYSSAIFFVPLWDEEHALSLDFRDGEIVTVNESAFRLVDGALWYEWEKELG